jgi:hypothetical protein
VKVDGPENPSTNNCSQAIVRAMKGSKFIPAHYEGANVSSLYAELFFSPK